MPDGVSGDWETMLSRAYIFLTIGRQLAKAAATAADHVPDGTPEERSQIAQHVAAIYRILRAATVRRGGIGEFPMLGLGPATPNDSQTQRLERLQNGTRQFRHTFHRYRRHLNREERQQAMSHIRDLARVGSEINYANTSAALVMWITASDHITMWIAMSYRPHLHGL